MRASMPWRLGVSATAQNCSISAKWGRLRSGTGAGRVEWRQKVRSTERRPPSRDPLACLIDSVLYGVHDRTRKSGSQSSTGYMQTEEYGGGMTVNQLLTKDALATSPQTLYHHSFMLDSLIFLSLDKASPYSLLSPNV
jgi:hypothetical protein